MPRSISLADARESGAARRRLGRLRRRDRPRPRPGMVVLPVPHGSALAGRERLRTARGVPRGRHAAVDLAVTPGGSAAVCTEHRHSRSAGPSRRTGPPAGSSALATESAPVGEELERNHWARARQPSLSWGRLQRQGVTPLEQPATIEAASEAGGEVRWHRELPSPAHLGPVRMEVRDGTGTRSTPLRTRR